MAQVASFCLAAFFSAVWWRRWVRAAPDKRSRTWKKHGLFCGLLLAGSVAGAIAWGAQMAAASLIYQTRADTGNVITPQDSHAISAIAYRLDAAFRIFYGAEFVSLGAAKMLLLVRLASIASRSTRLQDSGPRHSSNTVSDMFARVMMHRRVMPATYRAVTAAAATAMAASVVAHAAVGGLNIHRAWLKEGAASSCNSTGGDTAASLQLNERADSVGRDARTAVSLQLGGEALALLLLAVDFFVVTTWNLALYRLAESVGRMALLAAAQNRHLVADAKLVDAVAGKMEAAAQLRRRLTVSCLLILVAFPIQASFDFLKAYSTFNVPLRNVQCAPCDPCQSEAFLINEWFNHTPEFQPVVVVFSAPLPLVLSLWQLNKAQA